MAKKPFPLLKRLEVALGETSSGNQNPSITYMALTARAANHAVEELNKQNI